MKLFSKITSTKTGFTLAVLACAFLGAATITLFAQQYSPSTLVVNPTGHGTQFGTKPGQGLAFYGGAPVAQQSGTQDLIATLEAYNLLPAGSTPSLALGGGTPVHFDLFGSGTVASGTFQVANAGIESGTTPGQSIIVTATGTTAGTPSITVTALSGILNIVSGSAGDTRTFNYQVRH